MNKGELIDAVVAATGESKNKASALIGATLDAIQSELAKGEDVNITGFGNFKISQRAARVGINPREPSQKINIPASKAVVFKAGKPLKEAVNNK